jgi:hypothetical protein
MPVIRTLYLCEQGYEDPWLLFEDKRVPTAKQSGEHCLIVFKVYTYKYD